MIDRSAGPSPESPDTSSGGPRRPTEAPQAPPEAPEGSSGGGTRQRILERLRAAIERRRASGADGDMVGQHPGPFVGGRPDPGGRPAAATTALDQFRTLFQLSGGEVVEVTDEGAAAEWVASLGDVNSVCLGSQAPDLAPTLTKTDPRDADLGISRARGAIGETGSLVLDSRDGRRTQLLVPTHIVLVRARDVYPTLADGLAEFEEDLPSALALHSGPSKSADIGQVMVRGVHGPGRVVAMILTG